MLQSICMRGFLDEKMYIVISLRGVGQREIPTRRGFVAALPDCLPVRKTNDRITALGSKTKKQSKTEMKCKNDMVKL